MPYTRMVGRHFAIEGDILTVFRFSGFLDYLSDSTQWVIDSLDRPESELVSPVLTLRDIEAMIERDQANGNEERIAHIEISDEMAVMLWLEGTLTVEHFKNSKEGEGSITIQMFVGGKERNVKIRPQTELGCAAMTVDSDAIEI